MFKHWIAAGMCLGLLANTAISTSAWAKRSSKAVDASDTVRALVRPGSASRKVEAANRAAAIAFWQSICQGTKGDDGTKYLSSDFVNHAPGLADSGQAFVESLRTREQGWKLAQSTKPLFALSTGELVMIGEGADAQNPQSAFHVAVMRMKDGKISEYWEDQPN